MLLDKQDPNILIFDNLDSTSAEAKRIIQAGYAENGLIVWAKNQSNSYGRYGKIWQSGVGNLHFSFILDHIVDNISVYPFISALAIRNALSFTNLKIEFKWPNDLLINDKKIAGILLESNIENNRIDKMICGIGLNVNFFPKELETATSLLNEGIENVSLDKILFNIMENYDKYLKKLKDPRKEDEIYQEWLEYSAHLNQEIIVTSMNEEIRGKFVGIDKGCLLLKIDTEIKKIISGSVFFNEEEKTIKEDNLRLRAI